MLRKGMIWMPMDKKDQLAELISNAETRRNSVTPQEQKTHGIILKLTKERQ